MSNLLEDLKAYFANTPREQVLKDWEESKRKAPKGGPTIREFMKVHKEYHQRAKENPEPIKHTFKSYTIEEITQNRCSKYEYLNFDAKLNPPYSEG